MSFVSNGKTSHARLKGLLKLKPKTKSTLAGNAPSLKQAPLCGLSHFLEKFYLDWKRHELVNNVPAIVNVK